jgi:signal transduction histidine kinase
MKTRFLILLAILILFVSMVAVVVSRKVSESTVKRLVLESARNRFSIMTWGFNAASSDVDLYSYLDFEHETMIVTSGGIPVFQYGTAKLNPGSGNIARFEKNSGGYKFLFLVDFEAELSERLYPVKIAIYSIGLVYAVLFAVFGWIFVTMVANPITKMADTIDHITSRNLRVRLPIPRRKDEFHKLVTTFNALLDDIFSTYERQAQLTEDLTHDIATPVQIMEGYRQLIERHGDNPGVEKEFMEALKVQLARLRSMTEALRDSLAAERARRVERADATAITARNINCYRELHPDIVFVGTIATGVSLGVAPEDFERIETILIDNAVKYGREGGKVEVELSPLYLTVRDYGMGIAPEERKSIFDRYHRSPGAAGMGPGSGIGLAILRRFSEEYGFAIEVESELGEGSTFRLRFQDPNPCR